MKKLVETKSASLRIAKKIDLHEYYNNVLTIKTTPGTCIVIQVVFSTTGDEDVYSFRSFRRMFFHLQPEIDLKAGSNVHINLTGYIEGRLIFVFQKYGFLSRNGHLKGVNTKQSDFAPSSADSLINLTVLPLTYAGMLFIHRGKFTMQTILLSLISGNNKLLFRKISVLFFWGPTISLFGLLVTFVVSFKARMDPLIACFIPYVQ